MAGIARLPPSASRRAAIVEPDRGASAVVRGVLRAMRRSGWLAAAGLVASLEAGFAREVGGADLRAIEAMLTELEALVEAGDLGGSVRFLPPEVRESMALSFQVPAEELDDLFDRLGRESLQGARVTSLDYALDQAVPGETPAGRPFMTLPGVMTMERNGETRVSEDTLLVLEVEDEWHAMVLPGPDQVAFLERVYRDFAEVDLRARVE